MDRNIKDNCEIGNIDSKPYNIQAFLLKGPLSTCECFGFSVSQMKYHLIQNYNIHAFSFYHIATFE